MARLLRWLGYGVAAILGLLLIVAAAIWLISWQKLSARVTAKSEHLESPTPAQLAGAERQARTLGCFGCHGDGLRGNRMFDNPKIASIWAPNLTLVAAHSTDQQLAQAIRQGVGADRRSLFIMPSEVYQHLSDQEVAALIAMIRRLLKGGSETPSNRYGPVGRLGIVLGKFETAPALVAEYATREPVSEGAQFEAGRRLAVLNCSGCHGPALEGQEAKPGEIAPDLSIVGAYDLPAFKTLLKTGKPAGGQKLQLMAEVARSDLSHMTDPEIEQLYAYLQARAEKASR
jgi:cytochrome c553